MILLGYLAYINAQLIGYYLLESDSEELTSTQLRAHRVLNLLAATTQRWVVIVKSWLTITPKLFWDRIENVDDFPMLWLSIFPYLMLM